MRVKPALFAIALSAATLGQLGFAYAQTAPTPQPTATPDCRTGAEGRPSYFGVSGGNFNSIDKNSCCTGTLGALVEDRKGNEYALSNNHVLARTSTLTRFARVGERIVQPGLVDTGCFLDAGDAVGSLSRWVPMTFTPGTFNTVDAAIARLKPGDMDPLGTILNIGPISAAPFPQSALQIGMYVQKMGRTSCLTTGQVDALDAVGKVNYPKDCHSMAAGNATFAHQILIFGPGFSSAGDSGSLVLAQESCPRALGLLFAGTPTGLTVVNPMSRVLKGLGISLVGGCVNSGGAPAASLGDLAAAVGPSDAFKASMAQVKAVKDRYQDDLLQIDEVSGAGIGAGESPDQAALVIFVTKDTPEVRAKLPSTLEGIPVKIVESGEFEAY